MTEAVAVQYMKRGWRVFPVKGKVPTTLNGLKDASDEERKAAIWWERHPDRGIALATGRASGVWVLDLDGDEGKQSFLALQEKHGSIPETVAARTGKGFHLYFEMPDTADVRNSASKVGPGIDVRGTGGYVVMPPSPHPDGGSYTWVQNRSPDETSVLPAPRWLLELVTEPLERAQPAGPVEGSIREGGRNQTLASLAGSMRHRGMSEESIFAGLMAENQAKCAPPLPEDEVRKIAASYARYEPGAPSPTLNGNGKNGQHPKSPEDAPRLQVVDWTTLERIGKEKTEPVDAVPTPWSTWNGVCMGAGGKEGLARSWHVIIGASSGAGKSLVATNLAAHAIRRGVDVCLFSLEMSQLENITRLLAILTNTEIRKLEHGRDFDLDAWNGAAERMMEQPGTLRTNERPIHTLEQIEGAMRYHAAEGCRLMIVDYLQLAWVGSADTLYQQITEVSHTIQMLAKDLRVTTVGLSQVNRRTSSGADKLQKEGLMGGSSLENDAEQVVLISKPELDAGGSLVSQVRLDKNRHGPKADWKLRLNHGTLQLTEQAT
jgi:hypothetical protein